MFFVSLHTETLQKRYLKHTEIPTRLYRNHKPFHWQTDSSFDLKLFFLQFISKDSDDSRTSLYSR